MNEGKSLLSTSLHILNTEQEFFILIKNERRKTLHFAWNFNLLKFFSAKNHSMDSKVHFKEST